jgi:hypothetical protein
MAWGKFARLVDLYIPQVRQFHPHPSERFRVTTARQEPYAVMMQVRICAGMAATPFPAATLPHVAKTSQVLFLIGCSCVDWPVCSRSLQLALQSVLVVCFVIGRTNKSDGFSCQARRKPQR